MWLLWSYFESFLIFFLDWRISTNLFTSDRWDRTMSVPVLWKSPMVLSILIPDYRLGLSAHQETCLPVSSPTVSPDSWSRFIFEFSKPVTVTVSLVTSGRTYFHVVVYWLLVRVGSGWLRTILTYDGVLLPSYLHPHPPETLMTQMELNWSEIVLCRSF